MISCTLYCDAPTHGLVAEIRRSRNTSNNKMLSIPSPIRRDWYLIATSSLSQSCHVPNCGQGRGNDSVSTLVAIKDACVSYTFRTLVLVDLKRGHQLLGFTFSFNITFLRYNMHVEGPIRRWQCFNMVLPPTTH